VTDTRHRDVNWTIHRNDNGTVSYEAAQLAVLMDIRDELKRIRQRVDCAETLSIPRLLRSIVRNTARQRCRVCPRSFETARGLVQHVRRAHSETR
jgi:hypothetical protein